MEKNDILLLRFFGTMIVAGLIGCIGLYWNDLVDYFEESKVSAIAKDFNNACLEQNYEQAHKYLEEIKNLGFYTIYNDSRDKLIREECTFLMSIGDEQSAKRIVFLLLQSYPNIKARDKMKHDILNVAKTVDNEYVIKLLENLEDSDETNKQ